MPIGTQTMNWAALAAKAAEAPDYSNLEAGTYDFIVEKAEFGKTQTGKDKFAVTFIVDSPAESRGRRAYWNTTLGEDMNPTVARIWMNDMAVFGADAAFFATNPTNEMTEAKLLNQKVNATLTYVKGKTGDSEFPRFKFNRNLGMAGVQAPAAAPAQQAPAPTQAAPTPEPAPATPAQPVAATPAAPAAPATAVPPLPPMA